MCKGYLEECISGHSAALLIKLKIPRTRQFILLLPVSNNR